MCATPRLLVSFAHSRIVAAQRARPTQRNGYGSPRACSLGHVGPSDHSLSGPLSPLVLRYADPRATPPHWNRPFALWALVLGSALGVKPN